MTLDEAVKDFLVAGQSEGLSNKTVIWYTSLLSKFKASIGKGSMTTITANRIRSFLIFLRDEGYSKSTVHAYLRALHRFFKWCALEYDLPNPMRNIAYPKQPEPGIPKGIAPLDVIRLLDACGEDRLGIRNRAIVAFLADTGCRAAGLCGLTERDIEFAPVGRAFVIEKGDKRRTVYFSPDTGRFLRDWYAARIPGARTVFHNDVGEYLTPNGLLQMLYRLREEAGVVGRTNPHAFRHGFAREYIRAGGDLSTLARLLGHKDVATTAHFYAVFTQDELYSAHRKYSSLLKIRPT